MISVRFKRLRPDAITPRNAYGDDAGWDLFAVQDVVAVPGLLTWVHTGIAIALPDGYYARIVGRSSAASLGLHVVEGVVDCGYRGEQMGRVTSLWAVQSGNRGPIHIPRGSSICQLIVQKVEPVSWVEYGEDVELPPSTRGERGYGSSN